MRVWVSWIAGGDPVENPAWEVVTLPAVPAAAVFDYRGDMPGIGDAWHEFMTGLAEAGVTMTGAGREVYLESEPLPQSQWLTQLQQPIVGIPRRSSLALRGRAVQAGSVVRMSPQFTHDQATRNFSSSRISNFS